MKYILPEVQREQARIVHPSQRQHHVTPINSPLYVVTVVENPNRYYSRYKLYQAFEKHVEESGAILYTVELALRDRHFEVTDHCNPRHIQLRTTSQIWHKENMLNIAISRLPSDWEYVAWVDADLQFARPDWATETVHLLQHYKILQMFSHAIDLGPNFEIVDATFNSFAHSYISGNKHPSRINSSPLPSCMPYYGSGHKLWHSGYAWAARRSALADLGGLGDIAILGSADHHMACALIGRVSESIHAGMHPNFKKYWKEWERPCHRRRADENVCDSRRRNAWF